MVSTYHEVTANNLVYHDVQTYRVLLDNFNSTAEELAGELERDRSNINRSLSTLREKRVLPSVIASCLTMVVTSISTPQRRCRKPRNSCTNP